MGFENSICYHIEAALEEKYSSRNSDQVSGGALQQQIVQQLHFGSTIPWKFSLHLQSQHKLIEVRMSTSTKNTQDS